MRLAGIKLGFYPIPAKEAERIRERLQCNDEFAAIDPCVGDGAAFRCLLDGAKAHPHGSVDAAPELAPGPFPTFAVAVLNCIALTAMPIRIPVMRFATFNRFTVRSRPSFGTERNSSSWAHSLSISELTLSTSTATESAVSNSCWRASSSSMDGRAGYILRLSEPLRRNAGRQTPQ